MKTSTSNENTNSTVKSTTTESTGSLSALSNRNSKSSSHSSNSSNSNHKYKRSHYTTRDETPLETALESTWDESKPLLHKLPMVDGQGVQLMQYTSNILQSDNDENHKDNEQLVIFCGHLQADLDSIAGAMAASVLYRGTPARASECNAETNFALDYWKCKEPMDIQTLLATAKHRLDNDNTNNNVRVCLVDFQQRSQLHPAICMSDICGIIDHHALQSSTIITERPIFVDIRPWGSVCTILAHSFALQEQYLPKPLAGLMLSAILSDTLNLRSPTTTSWDKRMVSMLVQYTGLDDVNMYAAAQFRAKSRELSTMSAFALVHGDLKRFKFTSNNAIAAADNSLSDGVVYTIGYSVIETTDAPSSLARAQELLVELESAREDDDANLTAMLLAIVDIVNLTSTLLLCGQIEESLAIAAYCSNNDGGGVGDDGDASSTTSKKPTRPTLDKDNHTMALPGMVSRKKDFIPPIARAITQDQWTPPPPLPPPSENQATATSTPTSTPGRMGKRMSSIVMNYKDYSNGMPVRVYQDEEQDAGKQ